MSVPVEVARNGRATVPFVAQAETSTVRPRVTVGIPVYNGERFVAEAIESHLAQTFPDFEIVISDNGSTDGTEQICRSWAALDPRIRYVRSEENRGAGWNFNRVLELARGDFFKWSAADDVCAPTLLEECVQALDADPDVVLAHPRAATIDENGLVQMRFSDAVSLGSWHPVRRKQVEQVMRAVFQNGLGAVALVHGVARIEALRSIRPFGSYFGSDFALVTELATRGRILEVQEELAYFRRHSGSSSGYKKAPSARSMQTFFKPGRSNRLRAELNLRRRYAEMMRVVLTAPALSMGDRALLGAFQLRLLTERMLWRIRFELRGPDSSAEVPRPEPVHWSEVEGAASTPARSA